MNAWAPTVMVPSRTPAVLGAMLKLTDPFPFWLPPFVIVIQLSEAAGVQLQPFAASTVKLPPPPSAPMFWLVGCRSNRQVSPSWSPRGFALPLPRSRVERRGWSSRRRHSRRSHHPDRRRVGWA